MKPLQADRPAAGVVLEGSPKFVRRAVRVLVGLLPIIQIGMDDFLTVEDHHHETVLAGDGEVVPLADGFRHAFARFAGIINRADHPMPSAVGGIVNLNFKRGQHIAGVAGVEKNTAVRFLLHLEFQIEDEIRVRILGPQRFVILGHQHLLIENPLPGHSGVRKIKSEKVFPTFRVRIFGS